MDDEKIAIMIDELGRMISDWRKVDSREVGELIEEMIIDKAAELTKLANPQPIAQTNCGCLCDECQCHDECDDANFSRFFGMLVTAKKLLRVMTDEQKKALATVIIAETTSPVFEEIQAVIKKICQS